MYSHVSELYVLISWARCTSIHGLTLVSVNDWSHCKCSLKVVPLPTTMEVMLLVWVFISCVHQFNHVLGCLQCTIYLLVLTSTITDDMLLFTFPPSPNSWHWLLIWIKISSVVFFYSYWDVMGMTTGLYFQPVIVPAYKCLIWGFLLAIYKISLLNFNIRLI